MRMYFDFDTNCPETNNSTIGIQVENITFRLPDKRLLLIGCNGTFEWFIEKGRYAARFKGLEFELHDCDGNAAMDENDNVILEWGQDPTDELLEMLEKATPISIQFYLDENIIPEDFSPTCTNIDIKICCVVNKEEKDYNFHADKMEYIEVY